MALENSPHLYVEEIGTPMLVIHGDKDFRVPIGEGLRLWFELLSESGFAADEDGRTDTASSTSRTKTTGSSPAEREGLVPGRELFLSEHVRGEDVPVPPELGL